MNTETTSLFRWECDKMKETGEHHVMTEEEVNKHFFVCSECNKLSERGRLGMREDEFMCTSCGYIHSWGGKAK